MTRYVHGSRATRKRLRRALSDPPVSGHDRSFGRARQFAPKRSLSHCRHRDPTRRQSMTAKSRAAWFRGNAGILTAVCFWVPLSDAADIPVSYLDDYRGAQQWNDQRSFSTDPITFSLIGFPYHAPPRNTDCCKPMQLPDYPREGREIQYRVPRNFIVWMEPWNGGSQTLVRFKATYPGFAPLTKSTEPCLTLAPAYRPSGCVPIGFSIRSGGTYDPPDEVAFRNKQDLFSQSETSAGSIRVRALRDRACGREN
jgi:hypothetical protein